jgi:hypothetical protein
MILSTPVWVRFRTLRVVQCTRINATSVRCVKLIATFSSSPPFVVRSDPLWLWWSRSHAYCCSASRFSLNGLREDGVCSALLAWEYCFLLMYTLFQTDFLRTHTDTCTHTHTHTHSLTHTHTHSHTHTCTHTTVRGMLIPATLVESFRKRSAAAMAWPSARVSSGSSGL